MKKSILTTLACAIGTIALAQTSAQPANAVLISQSRNGNTVTSRYLVHHDDDKHADFDIHYTINKATINPSYSNNNDQIGELKEFMAHTKDTTMHISAIHIVGYASPDGNTTKNDTLASHRAQSLCQYAINTYHPKTEIDTSYKTYHWADCVEAVENSSIPQKGEVLVILNSNNTEKEKEIHLRKLAQAWKYLTNNILPTMRYADISFDYGIDEVITRTTTIAEPAPKPAPAPATTKPEAIVVDEEMGIIIATPDDGNETSRRSERKARKANKKGTKGGYEVIYW